VLHSDKSKRDANFLKNAALKQKNDINQWFKKTKLSKK
tara:strand:+ start:224 stop:337 length:114 start_codon:yes stop_codon:yes gene_type:complete